MAVAVQWSSAPAILNRWCRRPSPAVSMSVSPMSPPRGARRIRKSGIGGRVSVRGELAVPAAAAAEAEQTALQGVNEAGVEEEGVECEGCSGAGWMLCDFCKGKKNNVKSENSPRIYRRCPTCKAAGYILCQRCRVYRCITYPDTNEA